MKFSVSNQEAVTLVCCTLPSGCLNFSTPCKLILQIPVAFKLWNETGVSFAGPFHSCSVFLLPLLLLLLLDSLEV